MMTATSRQDCCLVCQALQNLITPAPVIQTHILNSLEHPLYLLLFHLTIYIDNWYVTFSDNSQFYNTIDDQCVHKAERKGQIMPILWRGTDTGSHRICLLVNSANDFGDPEEWHSNISVTFCVCMFYRS